jgi:hypothetical protein
VKALSEMGNDPPESAWRPGQNGGIDHGVRAQTLQRDHHRAPIRDVQVRS